ncbi:MAG TPA: flagellar hook capping FlgD N-terminal domain-containing protein [Caulobacteraceae bacterium]|nr:flagellar hook capping FlgD N-terminal domain-containing protein [Caulobacteraceae bacterium]
MMSSAVAPTNAAVADFMSGGVTTRKNAAGVGGTNGTGSTSSTASASAATLTVNNGLASLADNFQGFLTLLTTQLKNQDPTSPLDTNQFTQQITQMTGVEQQLLSNTLLQQLVNQQGGVAAAANLIGETVTAPGATSSAPDITGVVTAVTQVDGKTMLTVGKTQVPLSAITSVADTPKSSAA